jgi:hypothetical protein
MNHEQLTGAWDLFFLFTGAALASQYTKYGQQQKVAGDKKIIDFMSDSKWIGPHKKGDGTKDRDSCGEYSASPGNDSKKFHGTMIYNE